MTRTDFTRLQSSAQMRRVAATPASSTSMQTKTSLSFSCSVQAGFQLPSPPVLLTAEATPSMIVPATRAFISPPQTQTDVTSGRSVWTL
jgi:hypothetical protein